MPQYVFQNLEDPKLPVTTFHYQEEYYTLPQNGIVDLPEEVADHLNALSYPNYIKSTDPFTQEEKHLPIPGQRRFSLVPAKKEKAKVN